MTVSIANVRIADLHDRLTVDLNFNESVNIIYGKNGRGKTTLLHVIANALELDFRRFRHILFSSVQLTTNKGDVVRIFPLDPGTSGAIQVELNGQKTTPITETTTLTEAEASSLRKALGERSVYLPAFRAILERTRADPFSQRTSESQRELEIIAREEVELARTSSTLQQRSSYESRAAIETARGIAAKTLQCREWFGEFVPTIRYPALADVSEQLFSEYRDARFALGALEQQMFAELFKRVFSAVVSPTETPGDSRDINELLEQVIGALKETNTGDDDGVYGELKETALLPLSQTSEVTAKNILSIYATLLRKRSQQKDDLFARIREFEKSVNLFLDGKTLSIDSTTATRRGPRIVPKGGTRSYHISSLSSGERQVLAMLFCASRMSRNRGVFLIDEPELSLHVDWQRDILGEIVRQAGARQIIACTHSPEVGADHFSAVQMFEPQLSGGQDDFDLGDDDGISDVQLL